MITKEDFEKFRSIHDEFIANCKRVCYELATINENYLHCDVFEFVDNGLSKPYVVCKGEMTFYDGVKKYRETFDAEYLTMEDDLFLNFIEVKVSRIKAKELEEKARLIEEKEKLERKEYERLKLKFG